jgi:hypothetical protein
MSLSYTSTWRISVFLAIIAPLTLSFGCTNLDAVRSFAKLSASVANYQQVVSDYAESPIRQLRYQPEIQGPRLAEIANRRAAQKKQFIAVQTVIVDYMNALGDLAADEVANMDANIGDLTTALENAKFLGDSDEQIGKETVTAAGTIAKKLSYAVLNEWRKSKIKDLIRENDGAFRNVIAGFTEILDKDIRGSLKTETIAVQNPFKSWKSAAKAGGDTEGAAKIADILMEERVATLKDKEAQLDAYISSLRNVSDGHHMLFQSLDKLDKGVLVAEIKNYTKDIQTLKTAIIQLTTR